MPTIGSTNLQDTPSAGPLTAADLDRSPRVPRQREVTAGAYMVVALVVCVIAFCGVLHLVLATR
jgi:hypothetical protein